MERYHISCQILLHDDTHLVTLEDVLSLIASWPRSRQEALCWQLVEALVLDALRTGHRKDIDHATDQLITTLYSEEYYEVMLKPAGLMATSRLLKNRKRPGTIDLSDARKRPVL